MIDFQSLYEKDFNDFTEEDLFYWKLDDDVENMNRREMKVEIRSLREEKRINHRECNRGTAIVLIYVMLFVFAFFGPFIWYAICKIFGI